MTAPQLHAVHDRPQTNPKARCNGAKREEIEAFVRAEMQHVTERGSVDKVRVWVDGKPFDIEGPF